jgi:hypothetical protein
LINAINLFSIFLYLIFGLFLFKKNRFWPFFFFFYIGQLWAILSSYYIEQGIYLTEQDRFSYETGATFRLVAENLLFFSSAILILKFLPINRKNKIESWFSLKNNKNLESIIFVLSIGISLLIFIDASITKIIYMGIINKFNFYQYSFLFKINLLRPFIFHVNLLTFILGNLFVLYSNKISKKRLIMLSFILILIASVLQGSKFSAIYINSILFFIPTLLGVKVKFDKKVGKKIILSVLGLIITFLIVMNLTYREYSQNLKEDQIFDFILYRVFALQGHVWWGTDEMAYILSPQDKKQNIKNEMNVILQKDVEEYSSGLEALMIFISPRIAPFFLENGINFTMGFPALFTFLFNPFQIAILLVLFGLSFGIFIFFLYKAILSKNILYIILLGYMYIYGVMQIFSMGKTAQFFNVRIYLIIALLLYFSAVSTLIIKIHQKRNYKNETIHNYSNV